MKKLICCLLAVMMLFTAASTFAFAAPAVGAEKNDALRTFLDETDTETKDLIIINKYGDQASDLLVHMDGEIVHLIRRNNGVEETHEQITPTGIYLKADGAVTLLRYDTVSAIMEDFVKEVDSLLEQIAQNAPEVTDEELPTEAELNAAAHKLAMMTAAAAAQERADAATLNSAAIAFASKFKPEYILDVNEEYGVTEVSLRSDAYAAALAEAVDEMMLNPALAELVDRQAALTGGKTFAQAQAEWLLNRDAVLEAISTVESTEVYDENGHWASHYQIGDALSEDGILTYDTDVWVDEENGEAVASVTLGYKDEDPLMTYAFSASPYSYWEMQTAGDSSVEVQYGIENSRIRSGKVITVVDGNEEMRMDFGPDYLYMKGPKGGISTSVRETWTGRTRYEMVAETAEGETATIYFDFYQDEDCLVCEMYTDESLESDIFRLSISRIDKKTVEDLSAAENITEITADKISSELESLMKPVMPVMPAEPQAA